ncbi:hypothetical protein D3C81_1437490 [compost metagenome]
MDRVHRRDALGTIGDVDRTVQVVHEDADDLAEAQRHDGQVVAAQLERWRPQQHAEGGGHQDRDRQHEPHRQVQAGGEQLLDPLELVGQVGRAKQRHHVRAHRIERDIAQVKQAGKAHHDVQAQRQHDVQQRKVQHADPVVAAQGLDDKRRAQRNHQKTNQRGQGLGRHLGRGRDGGRGWNRGIHGFALLRRDPPRVRP